MSYTPFVNLVKLFHVNKLHMVFVLRPFAATDAKQGKRLEKVYFAICSVKVKQLP